MDRSVFLEWLNEYSDVMSYDDYIYRIGRTAMHASAKSNGVCPKCHTPINALWKCYWEKTNKCYACGANISLPETGEHNRSQEEGR